jgi:hypothetical protein
VFLLLLAVWPSFRISHNIQPTAKTAQIQTGSSTGPLVTEDRPISAEHHRYRLQIGFPLKPALTAEYSMLLEKPALKNLEPSVTTMETTSFFVIPDPLGILISALCIIGATSIFLRHRNSFSKT